jgi:hypothetical protein
VVQALPSLQVVPLAAFAQGFMTGITTVPRMISENFTPAKPPLGTTWE